MTTRTAQLRRPGAATAPVVNWEAAAEQPELLEVT